MLNSPDFFFEQRDTGGMSEAAIKAAIEKVRPRLRELILAASSEDAAMVRIRDEIFALLENNDLMSLEYMHCKSVGVHPVNRYGDGVVPADVIQLISNILTDGFSLNQCKDACCVELPPSSHKLAKSHKTFNVDLMTNSLGVLPPYEGDGEQIVAVSGTCGHNNQGLHLLFYSMPLGRMLFL